MKKCPDCAEEVQVQASVCRYCGFRFDGQTAGSSALTIGQEVRAVGRGLRESLKGFKEGIDRDRAERERLEEERLASVPDEAVTRLARQLREAKVKLRASERDRVCRLALARLWEEVGPGEAEVVLRTGQSRESFILANEAGMIVRGSLSVGKLPKSIKWDEVERAEVGRGIFRRELWLTIRGNRHDAELGCGRRRTMRFVSFISKRLSQQPDH